MVRYWRDRKACSCVVAYVAVLEQKIGRSLYIFQASYSSGVSASAGTHSGGGAIDTGTLTWSELKMARKLGGAAWNRTRAQGFDPHCHIIICGCPHASSGAKFQVSEYRNGRNGLANRRSDDGPRVRYITWANWIKKYPRPKPKPKPKPRPVVKRVIKPITINGKKYPGIGHLSIRWLKRLGHYKGARDGKWSPDTQIALDAFRASLGWTGPDITGPPGVPSVTVLAKKAGSKLTVKA